MTTYKDNYPHSIEAPQRVYVQYSQDITFDYSTGKYPLGETYEGFIWESVYIPIPHTYNDTSLGRHVWMRWRIGEDDAWTLPMRLTDSFSNIATTEAEVVEGTDEVKFRLVYTLDSGEVIYSEYITLSNGADGVGIDAVDIVGTSLHITYTDGSTEDLGRVVGYDGNGLPSSGSEVAGNIVKVDSGGNLDWIPHVDALNEVLDGIEPIMYADGIFSHSDDDGYRHIPVGGSAGYALITDGAGVHTWFELGNAVDGYIPWSALDDAADVGDTASLWSADKIATMFAGLSTFGIKYAVDLITDLAGITGMDEDDLCVVDEDRYVYKYDGLAWNQFFRLDAEHNHDERYYTQTQLNTAGAGGQVDWENILNRPTIFSGFQFTGDSGTVTVSDGDDITIQGADGITTSMASDVITINGYTGDTYIDIVGSLISHADTSGVSNTNNINGSVIQNLEFDTAGHVTSRSSINLDGRYGAALTAGNGISGSSYNGSTARTWNLAYYGLGGIYGSSNLIARGDHIHGNGGVSINSGTNGGIATWEWSTSSFVKLVKLPDGTVQFWGYLYKINNTASTINIPICTYNPWPPEDSVSFAITWTEIATGFGLRAGKININGSGAFTASGPMDINDVSRFSGSYYSGL